MGAVVGFIAMAIILPIFKMSAIVGQGSTDERPGVTSGFKGPSMGDQSMHAATSAAIASLMQTPRGGLAAEPSRQGFTLIESALATIIVGVGVLSIVAAQQSFHQKNSWSSHISAPRPGSATRFGR